MPTVSVIVTSFNQRNYLIEALESVLSQSLIPTEIIVSVDCSTDESRRTVQQYARRYSEVIKLIFNERNIGVSRNRSAAIRASNCEYVTWLDGDDRLLPDKLRIEIESLQRNPEASWMYSQVQTIDDWGAACGLRFKTAPPSGYVFEKLIGMLGKAPKNILVRREILNHLDLFDRDLTLYEDYEFLLRLAKNSRCIYSSVALPEYRVHATEYQAHEYNMGVVYDRLSMLLKDCVDSRRRRLLKMYLVRCDYLLLRRASKEGNMGVAVNKWKHLRQLSGKQVFKLLPYMLLLRTFLKQNGPKWSTSTFCVRQWKLELSINRLLRLKLGLRQGKAG